MLVNVVGIFTRHDRDRARRGREPPFDMQRFPGAILFIFGDALSVFSRLALRGQVELTGVSAADVQQD